MTDYTFPPLPGSAIVTGAATGIGAEVAAAFASRGVAVAVCDINLAGAEETAARIDAGARAYGLDVSEPDAVLDRVLADFPDTSMLVNSAGIVLDASLADTSLDGWNRTIAVNLTGTFLMCRRVAGHMAERGGGSIVNIASEIAHIMFADRTAYTATKAGVIGFTRALAIELAGRGVRANTVSPTVVMTEMGRTAWAGERGEAFLRDIPLGRFAEVEDVAAAVLFLCSQGATMITATDLLVDGGNTAH